MMQPTKIYTLTAAIAITLCLIAGGFFGWVLFFYWLSSGAMWGLALALSPAVIGGSYAIARMIAERVS